MSIMPHNTAPAVSATGIPEPIEGAGAPRIHPTAVAQVGAAWAAVAAAMRNPLANVNDLIPTLLKSHLTATND